MNVLLTGPFGKIGYRVIEALLERGHRVTCFDLDGPANRKTARVFSGPAFQDRVRIVWGNITDKAQVAAAVADQDAVIHNAAIIPPGTDRNLALSEAVNVGGTENIIAAIQQSPRQPLLVFPSSVSVHGNHRAGSPFPLMVESPLKAEDNYARHKIRCEELIRASGLRFVICRIGACMEGRNSMGTEDAKALMPLMFAIHPKVRVEYVHPKDVATAFANALDNPAAAGKTFFLGGGKSCQAYWGEFNSIFLQAIGCGSLPDEAFGTEGYYTDWMDTEDSQRILQFQHHSLQDYYQETAQKVKWVRPLLTLASPLIRRYLLSHSPAYQARKH